MELWLDTLDADAISKARQLGLLHGVTTNPSLISASKKNLESVLEDLLDLQPGPVAVQLTSEFTAGQVMQAQRLFGFSRRLIIKVPVTKDGLQTIHELKKANIPAMATAIVHPRQALVAALAGATYLAPYVRGINDFVGLDPVSVLQQMQRILNNYSLPVKILAASLRSSDDVVLCAGLGIAAVTLKSVVFGELISEAEATRHFLDRFATDWLGAERSELLNTTIGLKL